MGQSRTRPGPRAGSQRPAWPAERRRPRSARPAARPKVFLWPPIAPELPASPCKSPNENPFPSTLRHTQAPRRCTANALAGPRWWGGEDSNLRRLRRQIYSLFPLTAREPPHVQVELARGLEPPTPSLQVRRSTIELRQHRAQRRPPRSFPAGACLGNYSRDKRPAGSTQNAPSQRGSLGTTTFAVGGRSISAPSRANGRYERSSAGERAEAAQRSTPAGQGRIPGPVGPTTSPCA